jgi:hypothetical protein
LARPSAFGDASEVVAQFDRRDARRLQGEDAVEFWFGGSAGC